MKKVFIIHRWNGTSNSDWYLWLKERLVEKGFEVFIPEMPDPERPRIKTWLDFLKQQIGSLENNEIYLVGHSIGCQTILRYLQTLNKDEKIKGVVFVAPWLELVGLETKEEIEIAGHWLENTIDFDKVLEHCNKFTAIFSDNDPYVPISNINLFEEKLDANVVLESEKGHFTEEDNVKELQVVIDELLKFTETKKPKNSILKGIDI